MEARTPWGQRAASLLEEGPVPLYQLYVEIGRAIPPERALSDYRRRLANHRASNERNGYPPVQHPRKGIPLERKIEGGRLAIATDMVRRYIRSGTVVRYQVGDTPWVRALTPEEREAKAQQRSEWAQKGGKARQEIRRKRESGGKPRRKRTLRGIVH